MKPTQRTTTNPALADASSASPTPTPSVTSAPPHNQTSEPLNYQWAFGVGILLNVAYASLEAIAGVWTNSLALLADAGHNWSDVLSLLLAWLGHWLGHFQATRRHTYGWKSASILAALFNALLLLLVVGGIFWESYQRFWKPPQVPGFTIVGIAAVGVVINGLTTWLFWAGRERDLNVRGAFLHMAADTMVSLGVVVAGLLMYGGQWYWIDPIVSLTIGVVIFMSTWNLLVESLESATLAVPRQIDPEAVRQFLQQLPGVTDVHDLHIWPMSTTDTALTVHLVRPEVEHDDSFLQQASQGLLDQFGIIHATIQVERTGTGLWCQRDSLHTV